VVSRDKRMHGIAALGLALILTAALLRTGWAYEEGPERPPIPRTQPLDYYVSLVATSLPSYTPSMLEVPSGPNWMARKTVHEVAMAVGDDDPGTIVTEGLITIGYDEPDGPRYVKLDFDRGYIRYLNRARCFQDTSPCGAIPETQASAMFQSVVRTLGVPPEELGVVSVNTVMERAADEGDSTALTETVCEIERMVTQTRQLANGYPVFDSWIRGAISNLGTHARLLIDWPRFSLESGLLVRDRNEVIYDVAQRIWQSVKDENGLGPEIELTIALGYASTAAGFVPVARAGYSDIYDTDSGQVEDVPLAANPTSGAHPHQLPDAIQFRVRFEAGNGIAVMEFYLPRPESVQLQVLDVSGREIDMVTDAMYQAGWHQVQWSLRDDQNRRVPAGVYFATLRTKHEAPTQKILVVR
jgi:hypothetical protein